MGEVVPIFWYCPNCGERSVAQPYDIGSGPELACASCDSATGQKLDPDDARRVPAERYDQLPEWVQRSLIRMEV
jgi:hypothetical protein